MKFINFTEANFSQPVISISGDDVIVKVEVEDLNFRTFTWFVDTGTLEVSRYQCSIVHFINLSILVIEYPTSSRANVRISLYTSIK